jgi:hypothetical protein
MTIISLGYNQDLILSVMLRCSLDTPNGKNLVMAMTFAKFWTFMGLCPVLNIYEQKKKPSMLQSPPNTSSKNKKLIGSRNELILFFNCCHQL